MRRVLLSVVLCSFFAFLDADFALAKKGGGGRGRSGPAKSSRPTAQSKHRTNAIKNTPASPLDRRSGIDRSTLSQTPTPPSVPQSWTDPRLGREERKLDHRLQTAQHLRDNSSRNGNANLLNTADRMEQRAYQHYDSRLGRLGGNTEAANLIGGVSEGGVPELAEPRDDLTAPPRTSNTQPALGMRRDSLAVENSLGSDLQSLDSARALEERKLQHLFDVAQKLRDVAGRNGNANLLRTAEKIEQVAISRYERNLGLWSNQANAVSQPEVTSVPSTIAAKP